MNLEQIIDCGLCTKLTALSRGRNARHVVLEIMHHGDRDDCWVTFSDDDGPIKTPVCPSPQRAINEMILLLQTE